MRFGIDHSDKITRRQSYKEQTSRLEGSGFIVLEASGITVRAFSSNAFKQMGEPFLGLIPIGECVAHGLWPAG